jgi:hypothetical protein
VLVTVGLLAAAVAAALTLALVRFASVDGCETCERLAFLAPAQRGSKNLYTPIAITARTHKLNNAVLLARSMEHILHHSQRYKMTSVDNFSTATTKRQKSRYLHISAL